MNFQQKFDNERDAVASAKQLTKKTRKQHYCIRSQEGFIVAWYVEDEIPMLRFALNEKQIYPA